MAGDIRSFFNKANGGTKNVKSAAKKRIINDSDEEVDELLAESVPAIRYGGEDGRIWDRGLVTPTGKRRAMRYLGRFFL